MLNPLQDIFLVGSFPFRYYAIATPSATQRLLFGLLEAPPSWAPDALDAAVQLVELLRAAEDYASGMRVCHTSQIILAKLSSCL
jgi:hypothetical protein